MPKGTIKVLRGTYGFIKPEKGEGRDGRPAAVKVRLPETQASDAGGDDQGGGEDEVQA